MVRGCDAGRFEAPLGGERGLGGVGARGVRERGQGGGGEGWGEMDEGVLLAGLDEGDGGFLGLGRQGQEALEGMKAWVM